MQRPRSGCAILLGRRLAPSEGEPYIWFNSQGQSRQVPGRGETPGFRTALAIGHLLIDVLGVFAEASSQVQDVDPRLVQIWPSSEHPLDLPAERFLAVEQFGGIPVPAAESTLGE